MPVGAWIAGAILAVALATAAGPEGSESAADPSAMVRAERKTDAGWTDVQLEASVAGLASRAGLPALTAPTQEGPAPGPAYGTYAWPVRGPVLRGFDPPDTPFGSGHRGIDIGAPMGTTVVAAQEGVVAFAGAVAGGLYVSIDHPDGVRTTYSWLSEVSVRKGDAVARGDPIGRSGAGHPGSGVPHLHLGARIGTLYIDPMLLLERGGVVGLVRLAPMP
jgi:murein DD-endopeptidase MepM/ murein hydrolase activator NlpD